MSSERSIPHLRDIFGINGYTPHHTIKNNDHNGPTPHIDYSTKSLRKKRDNNKTLTSADVKTLERHLSMKKTIRKKIMRDLQSAFVDDPNEFRVDNPSTDQLKAEIRAEAFRFGHGENPVSRETDNFLDMLRDEKQQSREYSDNKTKGARTGYGSYESSSQNVAPVGVGIGNEKQSFWKRFAFKVKR